MVPLSPRQKEVVSLLMRGQTQKEIAYQLGIKPTSVRKHVRKTIEKLGARTLIHAVAKFTLEDDSKLAQELYFSI